MNIKVIDYKIRTSLQVKELALIFRERIHGKGHGLVGRVAEKGLDWDFFSPDATEDPFAVFEDDSPTFSVGASYGPRFLPRGTTFGQMVEARSGGAVLLQVWDRGQYRDALLRHGGDLSPASKNIVESVVDGFRIKDPGVGITQERGKIR